MITSKIRGHLIYTVNGIDWYYEEDNTIYLNDRDCVACGACVKSDEPDPCLGWLDGVDYACCGHGDPDYEYVKVGDTRYDSLHAWLLDNGRATISDTTYQQEV